MTEVKKQEFKSVPIKKVHPSTILPPRSYNSDLAESVKRYGIQQPLIVRPIVDKPREYEFIDGYGRFASVKDEQTDRSARFQKGPKGDSDCFLYFTEVTCDCALA
jgi:hypothetical protein